MALVDRNRWSNLQSDERIRVLSSCSSSSSALFENEHKGGRCTIFRMPRIPPCGATFDENSVPP